MTWRISKLSGTTVYVYDCDAVGGDWYPVLAVTVNVPPVASVGAPEINPDGFRMRPAGMFVELKDWVVRPLTVVTLS